MVFGRVGNFIARLQNIATHCKFLWGKHGSRISIFIEVALIYAVRVGTYKIDGHVVLHAKIDHLGFPSSPGRTRSPNTVCRVYTLHSLGTVFIKLEIIGLSSRPESGRQVGFVPNFEIPSFHLVNAVAVGPVLHNVFDQIGPLVVIFRRCYIAPPPKDGFLSTGQRMGHETQFNKRFDVDADQIIEQRIDVHVIVFRMPVFIFFVNSHVVGKKSVETNVAETTFIFHISQLLLPVGTQSFVGTACSDAFIEHGIQLAFFGIQIQLDCSFVGFCFRRLRPQRSNPKNQHQED